MNSKCILFSIVLFLHLCSCKKHDGEDKPKWAKKDIRDYNEADLERLLDQWEVGSTGVIILKGNYLIVIN